MKKYKVELITSDEYYRLRERIEEFINSKEVEEVISAQITEIKSYFSNYQCMLIYKVANKNSGNRL